MDQPNNNQILIDAMNRAASELEGQGEKSDRIACQLLTALARFEALQGNDPLALQALEAEEPDARPAFRIEWCRWEHGGGAGMQEWRSQCIPKEISCRNEAAMRDYARALDIEYAPTFRHRVVRDV